jgi:uncharacterized protein (DUF362 family)
MKNSKVVVGSICEVANDLDSQIYDSSVKIGFKESVESAKAIFIKPNLTYPVYKKGVTTRVEFIRSLVNVISDINPLLKIVIGEGEGGYNSFSMLDAFKNMGFFDIQKDFSQVEIVNVSDLPTKEVVIEIPGGQYKIGLSTIFDDVDFSISCPVPKVHGMTKISLSYKNQWGCLPDIMRLKNHYVFDYIISKICEEMKFQYVFMDGKYGLTNNGPMVGDPLEVNWFAASNSLGAFDSIISEMMGFDWRQIKHLKMASQYGYVPSRDDIDIIGDIESLRTRFVLKRNFWHYPALAAFHSKSLTNLFYFSRFSKILHDVMYTFRKRPIDPTY